MRTLLLIALLAMVVACAAPQGTPLQETNTPDIQATDEENVEQAETDVEDMRVPETDVENVQPTETLEPTGEVKTFVMTGENFKFVMDGEDNPTITVNKGDTVRIEFTSTQGFHDWVVDEFNAATQKVQSPDSTFVEFVADQTGQFEYYCSVGSHRANGMWGTLIVEE